MDIIMEIVLLELMEQGFTEEEAIKMLEAWPEKGLPF